MRVKLPVFKTRMHVQGACQKLVAMIPRGGVLPLQFACLKSDKKTKKSDTFRDKDIELDLIKDRFKKEMNKKACDL